MAIVLQTVGDLVTRAHAVVELAKGQKPGVRGHLTAVEIDADFCVSVHGELS